MAARSVTLGLSFAQRGRPDAAVAEIASSAAASWANMARLASVLGATGLSRRATTGAPASSTAAFSYSATDVPRMLATARAGAAGLGQLLVEPGLHPGALQPGPV